MWVIPTGTSSALKKKSGKESQYMVSHPELGSDPPIGSDRESGCDMIPSSSGFLLLLLSLRGISSRFYKTRENFKFKFFKKKRAKMVIYWNSPEKIWDFSRSRMIKWIAPLESSREI